MSLKLFTEYYNLPKVVWIINICGMLNRAGVNALLPIFVTLLVTYKGMSLANAGLVVAALYCTQPIGGFLTHPLLLRFRIYPCQITLVILLVILFFLDKITFIYINHELCLSILLILINAAIGLVTSISESLGLIIISNNTMAKQKSMAFSFRYMLLNVGNVGGPLLALLIGVNRSFSVINITIFSLLACVLLLCVNPIKENKFYEERATTSMFASFHHLVKDTQFIYFICAAIISYLIFSFQNVLLAYIIKESTNNLNIFTTTYMVNGFVIVTLQIPIINFLQKHFNLHKIFQIGFCFFGVSMVTYYLARNFIPLYYVGEFIFTLGEICTLSLVGLYIDIYAPVKLKVFYFGINSFIVIGRSLGAIINTSVTQYVPYISIYLVLIFEAILGIIFIQLAARKIKSHIYN